MLNVNVSEMLYSNLIHSLQRGVEFMLVKRIEEIGFTVAEQVRPTSDGYKTIMLSSGNVGESLNTFLFYLVELQLSNKYRIISCTQNKVKV